MCTFREKQMKECEKRQKQNKEILKHKLKKSTKRFHPARFSRKVEKHYSKTELSIGAEKLFEMKKKKTVSRSPPQ